MPCEISTFQLPCGARCVRTNLTGTLTGEETTAALAQMLPGAPFFGLPCLVLTLEMQVMTPEARSLLSSWKEPAPTAWFAIVVTNPVTRVLSNFILRVSRTTQRRLFSSEPEALKWLDEHARQDAAK